MGVPPALHTETSPPYAAGNPRIADSLYFSGLFLYREVRRVSLCIQNACVWVLIRTGVFLLPCGGSRGAARKDAAPVCRIQ
jgi:hypothetical protein